MKDHVIMFGYSDTSGGSPFYETYAHAIMPIDALQVDTKIDDGKPTTGKVINSPRLKFINCTNASLEYNVTYSGGTTGRACGFLIDADL